MAGLYVLLLRKKSTLYDLFNDFGSFDQLCNYIIVSRNIQKMR